MYTKVKDRPIAADGPTAPKRKHESQTPAPAPIVPQAPPSVKRPSLFWRILREVLELLAAGLLGAALIIALLVAAHFSYGGTYG